MVAYIIENTKEEVLQVFEANKEKFMTHSEVEKFVSHYTRGKTRQPIYKFKMEVVEKKVLTT